MQEFIEIRPVPFNGKRPEWWGPEDRDFGSEKKYEVLYDPDIGGYATGLTPEEEEKYSNLLGVDLSRKFDPEKPHPYWSSPASWLRLPNRTTLLNPNNPRDFVKWKNMLASRYVANSIEEWEKGLWPDATHVIYDERQNAALKASKVQLKQKAYVALSPLSTEQKRTLFEAVTSRSGKGHNADSLDLEFAKIIEGDVEEPNIAKLLRYLNMSDKEKTTRSMIVRGLEKFVLRHDGPAIMYLDSMIGYDFEDAVTYFLNPTNQQIKLAIMEKIEEGSSKPADATPIEAAKTVSLKEVVEDVEEDTPPKKTRKTRKTSEE